jgi:SAM-dependent methyltransferase
VLDVGCGTGIFPRYLSAVLPQGVQLQVDLLDISQASLNAAAATLDELPAFAAGRLLPAAIESIPELFDGQTDHYDLIWAVHSFTTVDLASMKEVYASLYRLLRQGGAIYVYQLAADSSYQRLHGKYRAQHPHGRQAQAYMECEDSQAILTELGLAYQRHQFRCEHRVAAEGQAVLENYLHKCILDDEVDVQEFFAEELAEALNVKEQVYRFRQQVNLLVIRKA